MQGGHECGGCEAREAQRVLCNVERAVREVPWPACATGVGFAWWGDDQMTLVGRLPTPGLLEEHDAVFDQGEGEFGVGVFGEVPVVVTGTEDFDLSVQGPCHLHLD
ncbi:hypothetical protein DAETH_06480 [Deinococcus aetherius]|uniref:Uncharacterized protein n=1 Tax=Deinococcus aetherius TaxID=200252 RepID=A0ABM8AAG0_9DEIO|nr:hypothetical protein DAETH_06480 [Deinococcus aetherius]